MSATLREGFTTGTAASAAAKAALWRLLSGESPGTVSVALPPFSLPFPYAGHGGSTAAPGKSRLDIPVAATWNVNARTACGEVIKDGGSDPDATHGARIRAYVSLVPFAGNNDTADGGQKNGGIPPRLSGPVTLPGGTAPLLLYTGEGIGIATLSGLPVPAGEPAVNPEPRKQIAFALLETAALHGYAGPLHVLLSVPGGAARAKQTMNARLGILGGISILGTRGTVKPYSHEAWKATIVQGMDVASALGLTSVLCSTGRRSERLAFALHPDLPPQAGVQVADYAAFAVHEAAIRPFERIIWACFPGKLLKLAQGLEWTHAKGGDTDIALLARYCAEAGGPEALIRDIAAMPTATGAFACMAHDAALHGAVLERLAHAALRTLRGWLDRETPARERAVTLHVFALSEELLLTMTG